MININQLPRPVRVLSALLLALASLLLTPPAYARAVETTTLSAGIEALTLADESRTGYDRAKFRHWNAGAIPDDGCNTRAEVLLAEAVEAPTVTDGCTISGGSWDSYYDHQTVTNARSLDIDHMVPLAESWDSGASAWSATRREAYANDLGADTSLVAVTARTNRSKSDQDPDEWLPPSDDVHCRYISEWTITKLRWNLSVDLAERNTLRTVAAGCGERVLTYTPVP
ncbi:HNH endonuclease family protein [Streptomyces sp. NPDC006638]|uniref:HNH endonuclease family protein n=1 Tax=Streptomyces sp. NPDC006638 TaxID=3157183 RepID=UPI0033BF511D